MLQSIKDREKNKVLKEEVKEMRHFHPTLVSVVLYCTLDTLYTVI